MQEKGKSYNMARKSQSLTIIQGMLNKNETENEIYSTLQQFDISEQSTGKHHLFCDGALLIDKQPIIATYD